MKEQLKAHEAKMQKTLDVLAKELAAVRAGRANPAVRGSGVEIAATWLSGVGAP